MEQEAINKKKSTLTDYFCSEIASSTNEFLKTDREGKMFWFTYAQVS